MQYSMFGSILTLGGLIGAIFSGKVADVLGRKRVGDRLHMFLFLFCLIVWLNRFPSAEPVLTYLFLLFSGKKQMMLFCEAFCVTGWLVIALAKVCLSRLLVARLVYPY